MEDKVGITYDAVINSIQEYGVFVSIPENGCEGLIRLTEIDGDTYTDEVQKHRVVGLNTNKKLHLGNKVFVTITGVNMERKEVNLKLMF